MIVHIGTSGWSYEHWQGVLYPTSYHPYIQTIKPSRSWLQRIPQGFLMTVKAPRGLMHSKHLYSPQKEVERMSEELQCPWAHDWVFCSSSSLLHLLEAGFISVTEFAAGSSGFSLGFPQIKNTESNGRSRYQFFQFRCCSVNPIRLNLGKFASLD